VYAGLVKTSFIQRSFLHLCFLHLNTGTLVCLYIYVVNTLHIVGLLVTITIVLTTFVQIVSVSNCTLFLLLAVFCRCDRFYICTKHVIVCQRFILIIEARVECSSWYSRPGSVLSAGLIQAETAKQLCCVIFVNDRLFW